MIVAYQGEPGAYSEEALLEYIPTCNPASCPSLEDVWKAIENGNASSGFVPIENSIEGSITRTFDLLWDRSILIRGEHIFRVHHCLIALPGVKLKEIKRVYSHPQALGQCREFLKNHNYEAIGWYDTAGSVKMIKSEGMRDAAAIASRRAAELYEMNVLSEGLESSSQNYTRFIQISKEGRTDYGKTTIAFTLKNESYTLADALGAMGNLVKITMIESRPIVGSPWNYIYTLDLVGDTTEVVKNIIAFSDTLKILGSYPPDQPF
jgi:prephenate dehydratase